MAQRVTLWEQPLTLPRRELALRERVSQWIGATCNDPDRFDRLDSDLQDRDQYYRVRHSGNS